MPSAARPQTTQDRRQQREGSSSRQTVARATTTPPAASQGHSGHDADDGAEVLAEFPRRTPEGGPARLRVMLSEFRDRHVLHIRIWTGGKGRTLLPSKAGITVSLREIDDVIRALERAKSAMMGSVAERIGSSDRRRDAPNERIYPCNVAPPLNALKPPLSQDDAARARSMAPWE